MTPEREAAIAKRIKEEIKWRVEDDFFLDDIRIACNLDRDPLHGRLTFTADGQTWLVTIQPRHRLS